MQGRGGDDVTMEADLEKWGQMVVNCVLRDLSLIPGSGRSLEKRMATHSSILAWRIP